MEPTILGVLTIAAFGAAGAGLAHGVEALADKKRGFLVKCIAGAIAATVVWSLYSPVSTLKPLDGGQYGLGLTGSSVVGALVIGVLTALAIRQAGVTRR